VYENSIGTKMNDLDLCLEVYQGHVKHCVTFDVGCLDNSEMLRSAIIATA